MTVREEIAKNLLYYRKKSGMTQKELASKLNINNSAVSNWEKGLNSIDIETLNKVCVVFGISVNDMFGIFSNDSFKSGYNSLNDIGKKKVDDYLRDLIKIEKYTNTSTNSDIPDNDIDNDTSIPYIAAYDGDIKYSGKKIPLNKVVMLEESDD